MTSRGRNRLCAGSTPAGHVCLALAISMVSCSPSVHEVSRPPPGGRGVEPMMRLWPIRAELLKVPVDLAFVDESPCLSERDPAFGDLFVDGSTRIVRLRASNRRVEAWITCNASEFTSAIWVYPTTAKDIRYLISFTEAGISIEIREAGGWTRECDEARCRGKLSDAERDFWSAQWTAVGELLNLSEDVSHLEEQVTRARRKKR